MPEPRLDRGLRERRVAARLQQSELARRVGVSRQTLSALEQGDSVPATDLALRLAQVLGCRVEDLFWLEEDAGELEATLVPPATGAKDGGGRGRLDAATARPGSRVGLARIGDRWVAHRLDDGGAAGFATAADGLLGGTARRPAAAGGVRVRTLRPRASLDENLFIAGCDPALALLGAHLEERFAAVHLHWLEAGSGAALDLLAQSLVHAAGAHLYDEETGEHNVAPVRRRLGGRPVVLVNLAVWEQGLLVAPGNPRKLRGVADLARKGVRVVGRESGTGSQELLGRLAAEEGVPRKALAVVGVARGHLAVAQTVAAGAADTGIATRAAAAAHGLDFLPLAEARFDLVFPTDEPAGESGARSDHRLARLLDVLRSPRFKRDLGSLPGYGTARTGEVVAQVAARV